VTGFAGFEPEVGEIRTLRSFRIGAGGRLVPLFSPHAWQDGTNEAECGLPLTRLDDAHLAPGIDCSCGFYGYGDVRSAGEYPFARYVLAVVACWGRVVAGTRGVRSQYARIEAVWLSPAVPRELAAKVAGAYPSIEVFDDRAAMLEAHPLTMLDCYDSPRVVSNPRRVRDLAVVAAVLAAGFAPARWITSGPGWIPWLAAVAGLLVVALRPSRRKADAGQQRRRVVAFALALWLLATPTGPIGFLILRLPLLQLGFLGAVQRRNLRRLARTFPAPGV
jgi:hypothetical protein